MAPVLLYAIRVNVSKTLSTMKKVIMIFGFLILVFAGIDTANAQCVNYGYPGYGYAQPAYGYGYPQPAYGYGCATPYYGGCGYNNYGYNYGYRPHQAYYGGGYGRGGYGGYRGGYGGGYHHGGWR